MDLVITQPKLMHHQSRPVKYVTDRLMPSQMKNWLAPVLGLKARRSAVRLAGCVINIGCFQHIVVVHLSSLTVSPSLSLSLLEVKRAAPNQLTSRRQCLLASSLSGFTLVQLQLIPANKQDRADWQLARAGADCFFLDLVMNWSTLRPKQITFTTWWTISFLHFQLGHLLTVTFTSKRVFIVMVNVSDSHLHVPGSIPSGTNFRFN